MLLEAGEAFQSWQLSAANKSMELLGRHLALFKDNLQVEKKDGRKSIEEILNEIIDEEDQDEDAENFVVH